MSAEHGGHSEEGATEIIVGLLLAFLFIPVVDDAIRDFGDTINLRKQKGHGGGGHH